MAAVTGSFTAFCKNALRTLALAWVFGVSAHAAARSDATHAMALDHAKLSARDGRWYLDAKIRFQFPEEVIQAVQHGVDITLVAECRAIKDPISLLFREPISQTWRTRWHYQAVARQYEVGRDDERETKSFASLQGALDELGLVRERVLWPLQSAMGVVEVEFAAYLDVEALPLPLRLSAYASPVWRNIKMVTRWPFPH